MTAGELALLCAAAALGGAINGIAGGGSFLTFPALVFLGVPPLTANATSTVALWPGSLASAVGYRAELKELRGRLWSLGLLSLLGGSLGALAAIAMPPKLFVNTLPFLLLLAVCAFTFQEQLRARLNRTQPAPRAVHVMQFFISLYGGYFGGGMGLMMLAAFSLLGMTALHSMNALKSILGVAINFAALAIFALSGSVDWKRALVMAVAASLGGFGSVFFAKRISVHLVKNAVIAIGWATTFMFFYRTFF